MRDVGPTTSTSTTPSGRMCSALFDKSLLLQVCMQIQIQIQIHFSVMRALWPTTLLAPPLLATRPRLLRPIEPRLAARLDATVAIPQPQSSPDSRPATEAELSEQLQPAHHRPPRHSSSHPDVDLASHDAAEAAVLDLRSSGAATSCCWSPPSPPAAPACATRPPGAPTAPPRLPELRPDPAEAHAARPPVPEPRRRASTAAPQPSRA